LLCGSLLFVEGFVPKPSTVNIHKQQVIPERQGNFLAGQKNGQYAFGLRIG